MGSKEELAYFKLPMWYIFIWKETFDVKVLYRFRCMVEIKLFPLGKASETIEMEEKIC